jgi:hypothetical protein
METVWAWVTIAGASIYVLYRVLSRFAVDAEYQRELNEILNKEEYRVKGRFE